MPATPRDGSAIELIGLQKCVLGFVNSLIAAKDSRWPRKVISKMLGQVAIEMTYAEWESKIQKNFEKKFYIPVDSKLDKDYDIQRPDLVNRRGIYKDTFESSTPYADYQLRPNMCISMVKVFLI